MVQQIEALRCSVELVTVDVQQPPQSSVQEVRPCYYNQRCRVAQGVKCGACLLEVMRRSLEPAEVQQPPSSLQEVRAIPLHHTCCAVEGVRHGAAD